jgi:iron(III) transport system permease protein
LSVSIWRLVVGLLLFVLIGVPLLLPVAGAFRDVPAWSAWSEWDRILALATNTLLLATLVLAVSLPPGIAGAFLLYRTDLPYRRFFRILALLPLFVPFPLFTMAWQIVAALGQWTPWRRDLFSAVCIHAVAALPWIVLLVGQGLTWVERELEEDALTHLPAWRVLFAVTLPRCSAAIGAAALWVALQTATEITVTDMMQVRTFAEEVYTQFVGGDSEARGDELSRAVLVALPAVAVTALLVGWVAWRWERRLPARATLATPPYVYSLGAWRWPLAVASFVLSVVLFGVPLYHLVHRAGVSGTPPEWGLRTVRFHMANVTVLEGRFIATSLFLAMAAGLFSAGLAFVACRVSLESAVARTCLLALIAVAWATPGPIVGLGLKGFISLLLNVTHSSVLERVLWYGPSPVPVMWVDVIRFFPCAVAVVWSVMRLEPRELREAARVDGAGPVREWVSMALPLSLWACLRGALAVVVLSLGELSAGKLVSTPGQPSYAEVLFAQMHYGVTNDLAARCLVMLALVMTGGALVLTAKRET